KLYRSRFRLLRGFSRLWLIYDRTASPSAKTPAMKIYRYLDRGSIRESSTPPSDAVLLTPCEPSKIVGVGRNYAEHAKELGNEAPSEPIIFLKPPSALLAPFGTIVRPAISQRVDHEAELAIVIG